MDTKTKNDLNTFTGSKYALHPKRESIKKSLEERGVNDASPLPMNDIGLFLRNQKIRF